MMKTEVFWDKLAEGYDSNSNNSDRSHVAMTKKYINKNSKILDFGCATGNEAIELSKYAASVLGIDISSKMIEIANSKLETQNQKNIHFKKLTIQELKNDEELFNIILVFHVLHFFKDTNNALKIIKEHLDDNGLVIIATSCIGEKSITNFLLRIIFKSLITIKRIPKIKFFKSQNLKKQILENGYKIVEFKKLNKKNNWFIVARKAF